MGLSVFVGAFGPNDKVFGGKARLLPLREKVRGSAPQSRPQKHGLTLIRPGAAQPSVRRLRKLACIAWPPSPSRGEGAPVISVRYSARNRLFSRTIQRNG